MQGIRGMATIVLMQFLLWSIALVHAAGHGSVPAVAKCIEMLRDMEAKCMGDKNDEATNWAAQKQFCIDTAEETQKQIDAGNLLIEDLSAKEQKLDTEIAELEKKIDQLKQDIEVYKGDIKAAKEQRAKDHESYTAHITDLAESVDALERATMVLQKQNFDRKQAEEALLQLTAMASVPEPVQRTVAAFVDMQAGQPEYLTRDSPEANAYEFQSGSIVELLKKLRNDFKSQLTDTQKEEMNSKHAADMLIQDLTDSIEGATQDIADKSEILEEKKGIVAEVKKNLQLAITDRDENVAYLADLKQECDEKSRSFEEKQKLRVEELDAIAKTIELLQSPDIMGLAEDHLPTLLQEGAARTTAKALAQLRRASGSGSGKESAEARTSEIDIRQALTTFLQHEGRRLHSSGIELLAQRVATNADPFVKVKKLIEEMIKKLLAEEGAEAEHKGWCDTELGTNKITRTKLQDTIDGLTAKTEAAQAMIAESKERVATLAKEINELNVAMKEASEMRDKEHAKNTAVMEDAVAAQRALEAAMGIFTEYYKKAAKATALVQVRANATKKQRPTDFAWQSNKVQMGTAEWEALGNPNVDDFDEGHRKGMQTFGKTFTGHKDQADGVLAMLEVIASDFKMLEADTRQTEENAAAAHSEFMNDSNKAVAVKTKETDMLNSDLTRAEAELVTDTKDLKNTQDQLLAANRVYENLKPSCVDTGLTYEKRAKARQEEIQSLQEALSILSGATFAA